MTTNIPLQEHASSRPLHASETYLQKANSVSSADDANRKTTEPTSQPPPPLAGTSTLGNALPEGGLQAWLQVFGSWLLFFNTWGILNTFGVYQTFYESGQVFTTSSSNISWIGSIQALTMMTIGMVAGPVYDRGGLRWLLIVGSFGVVFGHMMLSLCKTYWQALLAQGFVVGLSGGCLYVPAVAILPTYFRSRLGLALGVAATGSSMGGIIYPIMLYRLINLVGFERSVQIIGFTALATLIFPLVSMRMRLRPTTVRLLVDRTAFTDLPYLTFVGGTMIGFAGIYVSIFYTSFFAQATGIADSSLSFYLVAILNAASVFGRILPNWLSDKIGPLSVIAPSAIMVGVINLCNIAVHTTAGIVLTTIFFGFFSGVFVSLPPAVFVALTADKSKIGTRIGMGFSIAALGVLAGGPATGAILAIGGGGNNWTGTWVYGGVTALASGFIFTLLRFWKSGFKLAVKV